MRNKCVVMTSKRYTVVGVGDVVAATSEVGGVVGRASAACLFGWGSEVGKTILSDNRIHRIDFLSASEAGNTTCILDFLLVYKWHLVVTSFPGLNPKGN